MLLEAPNSNVLEVESISMCTGSRLCNLLEEIHRVAWKIPMQLLPECLSALLDAAIIAAVASGSSTIVDATTVGLGDQSGCLHGGSRSIRVQWRVLYFKGHLTLGSGSQMPKHLDLVVLYTQSKKLLCFTKSIDHIVDLNFF